MNSVTVHIRKQEEFTKFLEMNDFEIDDLGNDVYRVVRNDELPVFVNISENNIYFEVDLGNVTDIADNDFYFFTPSAFRYGIYGFLHHRHGSCQQR